MQQKRRKKKNESRSPTLSDLSHRYRLFFISRFLDSPVFFRLLSTSSIWTGLSVLRLFQQHLILSTSTFFSLLIFICHNYNNTDSRVGSWFATKGGISHRPIPSSSLFPPFLIFWVGNWASGQLDPQPIDSSCGPLFFLPRRQFFSILERENN